MRILLSSISVYGLLSLAALPVFAAEGFAIDLADIQGQISELEALVSPSDTSLVGALRSARLELLRTVAVSLENRVRSEEAGAKIEIVEKRFAPDPDAAASLLTEIQLQLEVIENTEKEVAGLGGLVQALAMSRLETEKLTLAGLRAAWMQAQYGLALPVAAIPSDTAQPRREPKEEPDELATGGEVELPEWADPNYPDIDYNESPFPLFLEAGYSFLGYWAVTEEKAELDDREQIWARNTSAWNTSGYGVNPYVTIGCIENEPRFVFNADDYLLTDRSDRIKVDYRIDERPAVSTRWNTSTNSKASGIWGKSSAPLMRDLMGADILFIRLTERDGERHEAQFSLEGTEEVVEKIAALCGFSTLALTRDDYRQIQTMLNAAGYGAGTPDGVWGSGSKRAMQAFQQDSGLEPTGVVDRKTMKELGM